MLRGQDRTGTSPPASGGPPGPQAVQTLWELCPPSRPDRAREELGPLGSKGARFIRNGASSNRRNKLTFICCFQTVEGETV